MSPWDRSGWYRGSSSALTCVRGGFSALERGDILVFFQRAQSPHPSRLGGIQIFSDSEGRFLFVSGDPQPERAFAHSCSGKDPVPAADGSGAGDGTAGSVGSMGGHSLLGGTAAGLTAVPFWKGTARSYRAFFRAHRLIVAAFGHRTRETSPWLTGPGIWRTTSGAWSRDRWSCRYGWTGELPDLPRKIGMAARQLLAAAELTDPTMPATGNNRRYCFLFIIYY